MNSELQRPVYFSTGTYPRMSVNEAVLTARAKDIHEPLLGKLAFDKIQICPQNTTTIDESYVDELKQVTWVEWRLHANVRLSPLARVVDACDWQTAQEWFHKIKELNDRLCGATYTLHAGKRINCSLSEVIQNTREIADLLGVRVGLEGHYPTVDDRWLISNWVEYGKLLDSGIDFVVDLSHLNIVAHQSGDRATGLVKEMLESPNCVEIHISDNDGISDQHRQLITPPWWWDTLCEANTVAPIFSEGVV